MKERRSIYFVFQGLLTIILLLFFLYERQRVSEWVPKILFLLAFLSGLMGFLARAPMSWLTQSRFQTAWFLSDVILTSITLYWIQQPTSDLYLIYCLVIFGTALTQNMMQSFLVAFLATFLYTYSTLHSGQGIPYGAEFWLRLPFLWIAASFTAILSHETREERQKQEKTYQQRLFHMERLAALGQISAEVAHRIKAPLTTIRVNAEVLAHQPDVPSKMLGELMQIENEVDHCKEILHKLLDLGRIEEMDMKAIDLRNIVQSAIDSIKPQMEKFHIQLNASGIEEPAPVLGDASLVREALLAVFQNAIEAMPYGGGLFVGLHWVKKGPWWAIRRKHSDYFDLVVSDTGSGIELTQLETIFRPFFTTKPVGGSGLGLSAALRILDKHGGSIMASSEGLGKGSSFTLTFPRSVN